MPGALTRARDMWGLRFRAAPKIFFHIRVEKVSGEAYNPTAKNRQKFTGVIPVAGQVNFGPFSLRVDLKRTS